jgi:peptidylprolyl isomerase
VIKEIVKGKGAVVPPIVNRAQVKVKALYTAVKWNGELFEERQNPHEPFEIEFGPQLNPGWEAGLVGMRVGGRREVIVPVSASYGTGSDEALVYVVDLIGLEKIATPHHAKREKQGLVMSKEKIAKLPKLTIAKQSGPPPKHIEVIDLRKGTGATLHKDDTVQVRFLNAQYVAALRGSRSGLTAHHTYPLDNTVKGWSVGLPGMKVGGRRELILPPKFVYPRWKPSWGYAPYVLIYVVDLLGVEPHS